MVAKFATATQLRRSATEKDVAPMGLRCLVANLFEVRRSFWTAIQRWRRFFWMPALHASTDSLVRR